MREDKLYNISGSATTITFSVVAACLLSLIAYIFYDPQVSGTEGLLSFLFNRIHTEHIRIIINLGAILISSLLLLWINNIYTVDLIVHSTSLQYISKYSPAESSFYLFPAYYSRFSVLDTVNILSPDILDRIISDPSIKF